MKTQAKHTATPWKLYGYTKCFEWSGPDNRACFQIFSTDDGGLYPEQIVEKQRANAEFIVKAVNSFDALVEALEGLTKYVERLPHFDNIKHQNGYWVKAKQALKQAEEA